MIKKKFAVLLLIIVLIFSSFMVSLMLKLFSKVEIEANYVRSTYFYYEGRFRRCFIFEAENKFGKEVTARVKIDLSKVKRDIGDVLAVLDEDLKEVSWDNEGKYIIYFEFKFKAYEKKSFRVVMLH